jgi:hypothetical protein
MARRRRKELEADLFSFLNIMAATIGVQTLLIVVMALQIKPGQLAVQFVPNMSDGNSAGAQASYVLCLGKGQLELVGFGQRQTVNRTDQRLDQFLDRIAKAGAPKDGKPVTPQYLVIGVRPDCYADFDLLRSKADQRKITLGYEPIDPNWKVKLPETQAPAEP